MPRPQKRYVDSFEHDADASNSNTVAALKKQYGDLGYAFWWYLLETLSQTDDMYIDYSKPDQRSRILGKTQLKEEDVEKCLDMLAMINGIDEQLWKGSRIIWCENLIKHSKKHLQRRVGSITKPSEKLQEIIKTSSNVEESAFGPVIVDQLVCYVDSQLTMAPGNFDEMRDFREILGDDLIRWAVDETVAANIREWRYTRRILQSMIDKNIKSVAEAKAQKEKKRKEKEKSEKQRYRDEEPIRWVR